MESIQGKNKISIQGKNKIVDPHHRYEMRKMEIKREKTKTVITNLNDIASDLKIPDSNLIIAYIKSRLAIAITVKKGRAIVTNDVDVRKIQDALHEFIEYFVLCKTCKYPELTYCLEKKILCTSCRSCGKLASIESNQYTDKVIKSFESILSKK